MWVRSASFNDALSCHDYASLVADKRNTCVLLGWKGTFRKKRKYLSESLFHFHLLKNSIYKKIKTFWSTHSSYCYITLHKAVRHREAKTLELHLSGRWLSGSPFTWIGLGLRKNFFFYCNFAISFCGLNFSPNCQICVRNYVFLRK
jgi:hypothetical protein